MDSWNTSDDHHMDQASGVSVCIFITFAWHCSNTFYHLFCCGQLLQDASCVQRSVVLLLFQGHEYCHPPVDLNAEKCVCVCLCVGVKGALWGEAGQSSPVAALGQGMAIQGTRLGSQPNFLTAPFSPFLKVFLQLFHKSFNSSVPAISLLHFFILLIVYLQLFCLSLSLSHVVSICVVLSLPQYFGKVVFLH